LAIGLFGLAPCRRGLALGRAAPLMAARKLGRPGPFEFGLAQLELSGPGWSWPLMDGWSSPGCWVATSHVRRMGPGFSKGRVRSPQEKGRDIWSKVRAVFLDQPDTRCRRANQRGSAIHTSQTWGANREEIAPDYGRNFAADGKARVGPQVRKIRRLDRALALLDSRGGRTEKSSRG